jgi:PST family polysaccharide transporter
VTLLRRTARGAAWTFGGFQVTGALAFASSIVVARLLDPSELGRYALVASVVAVVGAAGSLQVGGYYVVAEEASPRLLRTGLAMELATGVFLFACLCAGAVVYGASTGQWDICGYLLLAGGVLLTNPLGSLSAAFTRELEYRTPTVAQVSAFVLSVGVKIALVVAGFGIWGLLVGDVLLSAVYGLAMLALVPAGRGLALDRVLARRQLAFGIPLLVSGFLGMATLRSQDFIVAGLLDTHALGLFYLATRLANQAFMLGRSLAVPLLPAFSRSTDAQLARGFAMTTRLSGFFIALPLAVAVPLARPLVETLYGEKWSPAALALTVLFAAMAIRFVLWHTGNLLKSRGRVREITWLSVLQLVLTLVACTAGAALGGVTGVALGVLAVEIALVLPKLRLIRSVVPFRIAASVRDPLLALVLGTVVAAVLARLVDGTAALVAAACAVAIVFLAVARTTEPNSFAAVLAAFRRLPREA